MIFNATHLRAAQACTAKRDASRPYLGFLHVDGATVCGTDGARLFRSSDVSDPGEALLFKPLQKIPKKWATAELDPESGLLTGRDRNGNPCTPILCEMGDSTLRYPDVNRVIPPRDRAPAPASSIGLNPKLIADVQTATGAKAVRLEFGGDRLAAIRVTLIGSGLDSTTYDFIVMPVRT